MTSSIRAASLVLAIATLVVAAAPAQADLVVFTDGHFIQVEGYEVVGDRARLSLDHNGVRVQGGLVKAYWTPKRLNCAEKQHVLQMIKSYSKQSKQTKRSARKKAPSKRLAGYEVYGTAKKARKK